ncbi:uncharacterized protein E6C27_scaffold1268G00010 [Cucumis melo var. makuwa]|uniref:Uncharacterized protein n=1 Tax=Cucumis melo var. makuwa TaxID=1194695 RepID=A0A5A7USW4_CUCMM|nr:uncharacterized protein E6C27_scaffold1268G00010 [Cucumis melo var. makuwa]
MAPVGSLNQATAYESSAHSSIGQPGAPSEACKVALANSHGIPRAPCYSGQSHFVANYALPRLWVHRYPPPAFLHLNLTLHFKAMPSPRSDAAKWKDLINVYVFEIIDRAAESEKLISLSLYQLSERVGDKRTRIADICHRRNSSLYLKRYRVVDWNPILTKDSCGFGESNYRRTRKGELFPMPSPSGGERPRAGYGSIPSP